MLMRVVVIDDSAVAREAISRTLAFDPQIQVVGQAANANEARQIVRELNPDVITLDLEMPGMDGLGFLRNLMRLRPTPVVIISQHEEHDQEIREAMDLGALGYFPKHSLNLKPDSPQAETLRSRVRNAKDGLRQQPTAAAQPPSISSARFNSTVIGIGVSTGGLTTLPDLLAALPSSTPPIILVQHISAPLSGGLVARIQQHTSLEVRWGSQGQSLTPSTIFVAQAGRHLVVNSTPRELGSPMAPRTQTTTARRSPLSSCRSALPFASQIGRSRLHRSAVDGHGSRWCSRTARHSHGRRSHGGSGSG
jgi:two-component system chemotaxis response regulator CheB